MAELIKVIQKKSTQFTTAIDNANTAMVQIQLPE